MLYCDPNGFYIYNKRLGDYISGVSANTTTYITSDPVLPSALRVGVDFEYRIVEYSKIIEFRIRIIWMFLLTKMFSNKNIFIRKLFDKFKT